MAENQAGDPRNFQGYVQYISNQKAKLEEEKRRLEAAFYKVDRECKLWDAEKQRKNDELRTWRQKVHLAKEESMQMCEKLRKMEAERVSLVHQVCVEDYKLNEVLHRIEKVKTSKAAQDKLQKEHLRKLLAYEGDPLEDDTTLISLRKEIECLKKTKERLDNKEPMAMSILSGEASATVKAQIAATEAGLNEQRNRIEELKVQVQAAKEKKAELQTKLADTKVRENAEIAALEKKVESLDAEIQEKQQAQEENYQNQEDDDAFNDDSDSDLDFLMVQTPDYS